MHECAELFAFVLAFFNLLHLHAFVCICMH